MVVHADQTVEHLYLQQIWGHVQPAKIVVSIESEMEIEMEIEMNSAVCASQRKADLQRTLQVQHDVCFLEFKEIVLLFVPKYLFA